MFKHKSGGAKCLVPKNPTQSSYWPGPKNYISLGNNQFPNFRPLVLSQFGGKTKNVKKSKNKTKNKKHLKDKTLKHKNNIRNKKTKRKI